MELIARLLLAGILAFAAVTKLMRPRASSEAMATFGFSSRSGQWTAWAIAVAAESILAVGVAIGSDRAAYLAAALMALFAATLGSAMLRGMAGARCACFGGGSTVSGLAIARNVALAVAFAALPSL